jgi:cell pole-organizing protein PopZ
MSDQTAPEPTMEEILASIRRIISEDDAPPEEGAAAAEIHPSNSFDPDEDDEDVLELTERVEATAPEPEPPAPAEAFSDHAEPFGHHVQPTSKPEAPHMQDDGDRLVSESSATAAANAFGKLSAAVTMPEHGRTLEDVTKELLRPMLKAWLDEHLPRIVEAKVAEEVERVSRGRVR